MIAVLVFASFVFGFQRAVGNAFTGKLLSNFRLDLFLITSCFHEYMSGQGIFCRGKRPYVDMMNVYNSRDSEQFIFDLEYIYFSRYAIEIHAYSPFQETYNAPYHDDRDNDRDDRIDNSISSEKDNRPSDDDPE